MAIVTGTRFFPFFFFFFFLHHLFGQLIDCPHEPVLGGDDEKALKIAMILVFPAAVRLTCIRHFKQNFSHALADKVGLKKQERQDIVSKIFGDNDIIVHAADHVDIANRLQHMTEKIENVSVQKISSAYVSPAG